MKVLSRLMAAAVLMVAAACASTGSGVQRLNWDLGLATTSDAQSIPNQILTRHLYRIERASGPPAIMIQTYWRDRTLFDDERAAGFSEARTRFIVEARPRMRNPEGGSELLTVSMRAENMGRLATGGEWMTMAPTPEFREYSGTIAADIKAELENRTRIR